MLRKALTENLSIKIASILIALLVYLHVYGEAEHEYELGVPVRIEQLPQWLSYSGYVPENVRVKVRSSGKQLLRLKIKRALILLDLSQARKGAFQRTLATDDVLLPSGSRAVVTEIVSPKTIALDLDVRVERRIVVEPVITGEAAGGFWVSRKPDVQPDTVTVAGPAEVVRRIVSVMTEPVDISGRDEAVSKEIAINLEGRHILCTPDRVKVRVPIEKRK
ncbi:MAG: YbbR-like domain-containing protein [Candidatus Eisenbacteria bacterium]|nr:YbbR-like domain-containing protein [Candidatus Eisenbacteria bacterium]